MAFKIRKIPELDKGPSVDLMGAMAEHQNLVLKCKKRKLGLEVVVEMSLICSGIIFFLVSTDLILG